MRSSNYEILVVDDDKGMRNLIVNLLSTPGHRCVTATNGKEALETLSLKRFDAVVTDIVMPELDGIALTRELLKQYGDLPIMILTGHGEQYSTATAISAGAREFIQKPFSAIEFIVRFHKMMREHEIVRALIAQRRENFISLPEKIKIEPRQEVRESFASEITPLYPNPEA